MSHPKSKNPNPSTPSQSSSGTRKPDGRSPTGPQDHRTLVNNTNNLLTGGRELVPPNTVVASGRSPALSAETCRLLDRYLQSPRHQTATVNPHTCKTSVGLTPSSSKASATSTKFSTAAQKAIEPGKTGGVPKSNGKAGSGIEPSGSSEGRRSSLEPSGSLEGRRSSLYVAVFDPPPGESDKIFALFLDTGDHNCMLTEIINPLGQKWTVKDHLGVRPNMLPTHNRNVFIGYLTPDDVPVYKIFIHEPVEGKKTSLDTNADWLIVTVELLRDTAVIHQTEYSFGLHERLIAESKLNSGKSGGDTGCRNSISCGSITASRNSGKPPRSRNTSGKRQSPQQP